LLAGNVCHGFIAFLWQLLLFVVDKCTRKLAACG